MMIYPISAKVAKHHVHVPVIIVLLKLVQGRQALEVHQEGHVVHDLYLPVLVFMTFLEDLL
jgi:hypothetical protein